MANNMLIDYLFQDVSKLFRHGQFAKTVDHVIEEKILANDGVDSILIDTKINANNPIQQSVVDGKITTATSAFGSVIDGKIATNNTSVQSTVDSKIASNNTSQQSTVDGKISTNNTAQQSIVDGKITTSISTNNTAQQSVVDGKITTNNTTQQSIVDGKITANNTTQQSIVDGKITTNNATITSSVTSSVTSSINASLPAAIDTRLAATSVKVHSDVQDYTAANIPNGYFLGWSSGAQEWQATPGSAAKGSIRLFVAEKASNSSVFYFNAITVTALSSASTNIDTAFMVTTNLLNTVTIDLRSNQAISNSVRIDLYKNGSGAAFATATTSIANQTQTLTQYNVIRYTFTGLTLNTYDAIHIKVTPTSNPGEVYGIVTIS